MIFSSVLLLIAIQSLQKFSWCRTSEKNSGNALEIFVQLEFQEGGLSAPDTEISEDLYEIEEYQPEKLQDWELDFEDRTPFEDMYPQLARDYKYPPVPFKQLRRTIQSALRKTKDTQIEISKDSQADEFVHVENHQFMLGENPFYFVGFNSYNALQQSVKKEDRKQVDILLKTAKKKNLSVMRIFAFCDGPGLEPAGAWSGFYVPCNHIFQESPGVLNEDVFRGLDYLIYKARENGVRLVLTLTNYASIFGGVEMYARWAYQTNNLQNVTVLDFFTSKDIRTIYKAYAAQIISRVNTYTDIPYAKDATIMGWDVMNDARCPDCPGKAFDSAVNDWIQEMAKFVKKLAPKQLVTAGVIGHFGESSPQQVVHNPAPWVVCLGVDFEQLFSSQYLDFASMSLYPFHKAYNYPDFVKCSNKCRRDWMKRSILSHMEVAQDVLNKPVVIKEFGLAGERHERHQVFSTVLNALSDSALEGNSLGGVMFWSAGVKSDIDWDNKMVYIDGSIFFARRPQIDALEQDRDYKNWLDQSRKQFFRRDFQWTCQQRKEEEYFDLFTLPPSYHNQTIKHTIHTIGNLTCQLGSNCQLDDHGTKTQIYGVMF